MQTEAYARATFIGQPLTADEVTDLVTARLDRQGILTRPRGPLYVVVLDEQVLRRAADGDRALMAAQVAHLLACAELPNVQLHVVPADTPTSPGLDGPFVIADLRDGNRVAQEHPQRRQRRRLRGGRRQPARCGRRPRLAREARPVVDLVNVHAARRLPERHQPAVSLRGFGQETAALGTNATGAAPNAAVS